MTAAADPEAAVDSLVLRFVGNDDEGNPLHELRASHVAEVLQGVVGLATDFSKAGAFGDGPGGEVLVRPAREGSFMIEVFRELVSDPEGTATAIAAGAGAVGLPSLSTMIWYATRSLRADVKDFEYLDDGTVKVIWQDDDARVMSRPAWDELQKRKRRRRRQLRQIMTPLSDRNVGALEVRDDEQIVDVDGEETEPRAPEFTLTRSDYDAMRPEDEVEEEQEIFDVEAQMSAIDFDDPSRWRVKTINARRLATVEDDEFLGRVAGGMPIRQTDIFRLRVREDRVKKNGRTQTKWTVLKVESHRRAAHDDDS